MIFLALFFANAFIRFIFATEQFIYLTLTIKERTMNMKKDLLMQTLSDDELAGVTGGGGGISDENMADFNECIQNCEAMYKMNRQAKMSCKINCHNMYSSF